MNTSHCTVRRAAAVGYLMALPMLMGAWTMSYPTPNSGYKTNASVNGTGNGPWMTNYVFRIQEHGLGDILNETSGTSSWAGLWSASVSPPSGGSWPVGNANAVLFAEGEIRQYVTITFSLPNP